MTGTTQSLRCSVDQTGARMPTSLDMLEKLVRDGLHDVFTPEKLVRFRGHSRFPSQRQAQAETAEVAGRTKYVVARIWGHRDVYPKAR